MVNTDVLGPTHRVLWQRCFSSGDEPASDEGGPRKDKES